jgi:MFS family permease
MARSASEGSTGGEVYEYKLPTVISASSAGTLVEWYDFYIFGSLAFVLSEVFFPPGEAGLLQTLGTFAAGFVVRPFGAAFFGRIGDIIGRKFTFLVTISMMGGATFVIGLLPSYASIGIVAPIILLVLRLLQGLALGGEYGGAAIYVAEHAPDHRRGFFTSFIQTTATLGLLLSLIVIVGLRLGLGEEAFRSYGWRIPFLLSGILLGFALYIRLKLRETPLFAKLKSAGKTSTKPIRDAFAGNAWKVMALALLGATAGQGVVWYTGQFYAYFYLQNVVAGGNPGIGLVPASVITGIALILATPFFVFFGSLSDRIGRKPIILTGCALGALTYVPIYRAMLAAAPSADDYNGPLLVLLVFIQVLYVTMVYGPIAAFLVELFPGRIRYTSLSLPYHIGNGVFGGLVPVTSTYLVQRFDNPLAGLSYPIAVAVITFFVGLFFVRETNLTRIYDEVDEAVPLEAQPTT